MAAQRSRRTNAGNRMEKLIEEQVEEDESDDVYKTLYGGFHEEDDDDDYVEEEAEEDIVDSDFSLSEKEEENEIESDDEKKKRRRSKKKVMLSKSLTTVSTKPRKPTVKKVIKPILLPEKGARMRATTLLKSQQINAKKNLQNTMRRHPTMPQMRRLTQNELLAEAKITEEKNLASLAQFLKIEAEKKAAKSVKVRYQGPIVRFQSVRMPAANENEVCSRNFLEFTDTKNFPKDYFPSKHLPTTSKPVCVVTGLPAKYKDPLTGLPYATIAAFRYIRQHRKRLKEELAAKREIKRKKK